MKVTAILNQNAGFLAGTTDFSPSQLGVAFGRVGVEAAVRVVPGADLAAAIHEAAAAGPDGIVIGGGDGTLNTAAGILADTSQVLGILPLGTLNHFAKDLGISADWRSAVTTISEQNITAVDVAEVNERVFINNCSIGAYPEAVRRREALRSLHGMKKWTAMFVASLQVLRRLRRLRVTIEQEGNVSTRRTPFILIANNRYSGNLFARSLRPRIDAGELWVYTTHLHRFLPLLRLMLYSLTHRMDEADDLEAWSTDATTISGVHGPLPVAMDGEVVKLDNPLRFRTRPRALRVFAPVTPT